MTVRFNSPEEFLEELDKDRDKVERKIVRLTQLFQVTKISPNIRHVSVVATARVAGELYRLERYCGDIWQIPAQDESVKKKAEVVMNQLKVGCTKLGLEVRSGIIE